MANEVLINHRFDNPQPDDAGPHVYTRPGDWNDSEILSGTVPPTDGDLITWHPSTSSKAGYRTLGGASGITVTIGDEDITIGMTAGAFVDGTGTPGFLPKWSGATTLTDSIIMEAGSVIAIAGSLDIMTNLLIGGRITEYNGSAPTDGQLLIGNTAAGRFDAASLSGTASQIIVTPGAGAITLSTPQDIATNSSVQFGALGLGTAASGVGTLRMSSRLTLYNNAAPVTGALLIGNATDGRFDANRLTAGTNVTIDDTSSPGNITITVGGSLITGTGTAGRIPRFTAPQVIADGTGRDDGATAAFGGAVSAAAALKVYATASIEGILAQGGVAQYAERVQGDTTSGSSLGTLIRAGTTSADSALRVFNAAGDTERMRMFGDGRFTVNKTSGHAIGGTVGSIQYFSYVQLNIIGTNDQTGNASNAEGIGVFSTLKVDGDVGAVVPGIVSHITWERPASGVVAVVAGIYAETPEVTGAGAGTATIAATIYAPTAPTFGVQNYAMYLVAGSLRMGDNTVPHAIGDVLRASAGLRLKGTATATGGDGLSSILTVGGTMNAAVNGDILTTIFPGSLNQEIFAKGAFTALSVASVMLRPDQWSVTGAGTVTTAAGLWITSEPVAIGTNNYALYVAAGRVLFGDAQKHAIGGAWKTYSGVTIRGSVSGDATNGVLFGTLFEPSMAPTANDIVAIFGIFNGASITKTGTNPVAAGLYMYPPTLTGAGVATIGATVYISDATTGGATNYALYVAAGNVFFPSSSVGIGVNPSNPLHMGGSTVTSIGFNLATSVSASADNGGLSGAYIAPTLVERSSGVHTIIAPLRVGGAVTNGGATATQGATAYLESVAFAAGTDNGATLYVAGASTGAIVNYAIEVGSGISNFRGTVRAGVDSTSPLAAGWFGSSGEARAVVMIGGTWDAPSGQESYGLLVAPQIKGDPGNNVYSLRVTQAFEKADSSTTVLISTAMFESPGLIAGGSAAVTTASTVTINGAPTLGVNNYALFVQDGSVRAAYVGPHAFGGILDENVAFRVAGAFTPPAGSALGFYADYSVLSPQANGDGAFVGIAAGTIQKFSSGAHPTFAALFVNIPIIGADAGSTLTNAASVYIEGGPTGGSNNYALFVDAGETRLDGNLQVQTDKFIIDTTGIAFRGTTNGRYAIAFGAAGGDAYTSAATLANDSAYFHVRPASIANTSGTGDIYIFAIAASPSLNPTGASALGAAMFLDPPGKGGAGTFTNMVTLYISSAPAGGTTNYSLWVDAGATRLDGLLTVNHTTLDVVSGTTARLSAQAATGSDAFLYLLNTATAEWTIGLDASDSSKLKFDAGSTVGSATKMSLTTGGKVTILESLFVGTNTADDRYVMRFTGTFVADGGATNRAAFMIDPTYTPGSGEVGRLVALSGTLVEHTSGTHSIMAGLFVYPLSITDDATAVTTNAASVYIEGPPTIGSNKYSLFVDAGDSRFDGEIIVGNDVVSSSYFARGVFITGTLPGLSFQEASVSADERVWDIYVDAEEIHFRVLNDAANSSEDYLRVTRSGATVAGIFMDNGVLTVTDGLKTGAPSGGTANTWKLGTVASVSPTAQDRTIEVQVGATTYYISAKTTND